MPPVAFPGDRDTWAGIPEFPGVAFVYPSSLKPENSHAPEWDRSGSVLTRAQPWTLGLNMRVSYPRIDLIFPLITPISACPWALDFTTPITWPISFIEVAPVC